MGVQHVDCANFCTSNFLFKKGVIRETTKKEKDKEIERERERER
jgi:hypothetical protein